MLNITTPTTKNNIYANVTFNDNDDSIKKTEVKTGIMQNKYFTINIDNQTINIDENTAFALTRTMITYMRMDEIVEKINDVTDTEKIKNILLEYMLIKQPTESDLPDIIARYS